MKRTIEIESISRRNKYGEWEYVTLGANAKAIFSIMHFHSLYFIRFIQHTDEHWEIEVKGSKENIQKFLTELISKAADVYHIKYYGGR